MKFQVLTGTSKMTVIWDVALLSLVQIGRRFRKAYSYDDKDSIPETSVHLYETTRCSIPEDGYHRTYGIATSSKFAIVCEISGSHGSEYERS
jgi:hypothetical protein